MDFARPPTLWFANTVSLAMIACPVPAHSAGLAAAAQRKLWLMNGDDAAFLPAPVDQEFVSYVAGVTGCGGRVLVPPGDPLTPLGSPTRDCARGLEEYIREVRPTLNPYILDECALRFSDRHALPIVAYQSRPDSLCASTVHTLNSKTGFRALASALGLPLPDGASVKGADALAAAVSTMLSKHDEVIVKLDRSSNGYGHWRIERGGDDLQRRCSRYAERHRSQTDTFVVEQFCHFTSAPSIEAFVDGNAVTTAYVCDQHYEGLAFAGMISPPNDLSLAASVQLAHAAATIGCALQRAGYRGYFDVDAGVTLEDTVLLTECNVRRTAGTWIHELLPRLLTPAVAARRVWLAGAFPVPPHVTFRDVVSTISSTGIGWNATRGTGVLLPTSWLAATQRLRYVIVGRDRDEVRALERQLGTHRRASHARAR